MPGDMWDEQDEDDYGMPIRRNDGTFHGSRWSPQRFRKSGPIAAVLLLILLWWKAGPPSRRTDWSRYAYVSYATDDHNMCNVGSKSSH